MTKYEREKAFNSVRTLHESNIRELKEKINEAKTLLSVIPKTDFAGHQERNTVQQELRRLNDFLQDEIKAYKGTFEDDETAKEVFKQMGI